MDIKSAIKLELVNMRRVSVWDKGVHNYAIGLVDDAEESDLIKLTFGNAVLPSFHDVNETLLMGAQSWKEYSWGGCACAYIYDEDIAKALCTPSELKRTNNGDKKPNRFEEWLDVQARALTQASNRIFKAISRVKKHMYLSRCNNEILSSL